MGGRRTQCPGPSSTQGSLGPSHHRCHKSWVSFPGHACIHGILSTPHGKVRDGNSLFHIDLPGKLHPKYTCKLWILIQYNHSWQPVVLPPSFEKWLCGLQHGWGFHKSSHNIWMELIALNFSCLLGVSGTTLPQPSLWITSTFISAKGSYHYNGLAFICVCLPKFRKDTLSVYISVWCNPNMVLPHLYTIYYGKELFLSSYPSPLTTIKFHFFHMQWPSHLYQ